MRTWLFQERSASGDRVSEVTGAGEPLRYCKGLDIIVCGEFVSKYELGEDLIDPNAVRSVDGDAISTST